MLVTNIKDFISGWMIGYFVPSVLRTDAFEFAHHSYPKTFVGRNHRHDRATEYNYIVSGRVIVKGKELTRGDMFVFTPGEYCGEVSYLEETDLIIIKSPSVPGDKINEKNQSMAMPTGKF